MLRALLFGLAFACACRPAHQAPPADLIWVVVDTLRADHAGPRATRARTPAIDALAADGTAFDQAFCHTPMTLPSHVAMFSSRHVFTTGVKLNAQVVPSLPLLAPWLAQAGYRTAAVVSLASLWPIASGAGLERGFESYVYDGNVDCWPADRVVDEVEQVLDRHAEAAQPLFLFAHFSDPHDPYNAHGSVVRTVEMTLDDGPLEQLTASEFGFRNGPVRIGPGRHRLRFVGAEEFRLRLLEVRGPTGLLPLSFTEGALSKDLRAVQVEFENPGPEALDCDVLALVSDRLDAEETQARYRREVEFVDRQLARLFESLQRRGRYERALIVLTSDHGEALGEHDHVGHVVNLHEELLHVPLVIKLPGDDPRRAALEASKRALVRHIDLVPTVLEALRLPALPEQQGRSLFLPPAPHALLAETHRPLAPVTQFALRDTRFKLIYYVEQQRWRLFDIASDPLELTDSLANFAEAMLPWQKDLERTAKASAQAGTSAPVLDPERAARLKGLGY